MILKREVYLETPLQHDIEMISSNKVVYNSAILANIISKYIICFILRENPRKSISYGEYTEKMREIMDTLQARDTSESTIKGVQYQLKMALDIPATMEIMTDIIGEIGKMDPAI